MRKIVFYIEVIFLFVISFVPVFGQQDWDTGEIKDVEIEIVKDRQIILPGATRSFEKIPPRPIEPVKPQITYNFIAFNFITPELNPVLRPLKLKQEELPRSYTGYVSAGYGNYASPYVEAFITNRQDKKKLLGIHTLFSRSGKGPVDGKNSAGGVSGISAFAQTFGKDVSFNGNVGFEKRSTNFYGYPNDTPVKRDTIEQSYSIFNLGLGIANVRNTKMAYHSGVNFSYMADNFNAAETSVDLNFNGTYKISDSQSIFFKADLAVLNRKDTGIEAKGRNLFQVNGYYSFYPVENFKLQVGAVIALENDTSDLRNFHFYPDIRATYPINEFIDFVGSLSGGMEKVSLQSLANENLWMSPAVKLSHTNKVIDLQAGVRAKLGSNVLMGAGVSFAILKNLYFFMNDSIDVAKFHVEYDNGAVKRTNFYASFLYTHSEDVRISLQGDYFGYSTDDVLEAWHKPGYRVTVGASYNLFKKLIFNLDMIAQGNMKALDPETRETQKLNAAFDLNFRTEYLVSERFSVFVALNNITSNKYPVFFNYSVRGFQGMAGITWKF